MAAEWKRGVRWQFGTAILTHLVPADQVEHCLAEGLRQRLEGVKESLDGIPMLAEEKYRAPPEMRILVNLAVDISQGVEVSRKELASFGLDASGDNTKVMTCTYGDLRWLEARNEEGSRPLDFLAKVDVMEPWVRDVGPS